MSACAKPTRMLAGIATSIIFGLPSLRLFISAGVFLDRPHLEPRIERALSPMVETVSPL